jgi:hypothetical protein
MKGMSSLGPIRHIDCSHESRDPLQQWISVLFLTGFNPPSLRIGQSGPVYPAMDKSPAGLKSRRELLFAGQVECKWVNAGLPIGYTLKPAWNSFW